MDYTTKKNALDDRAALLLKEYTDLVSEIEKSGKHFQGFRALKETRFALEKICRNNGAKLTRKQRTAPPPSDLFLPRQDDGQVRKASAPPPTDLFVMKTHRVVGAVNTTAPNLFQNPTPPPPPQPIQPKREKAKADGKRKVLATSEEVED